MTRVSKPADPVRPSTPDPVDAWLDVLVAMLAIPKPDRQRVRDELEDHLRSRIDDLLIHGLTEPQALQKAVAELGETADLARQLSHAHKPPRTRRYAMHALLIALTGTVVALGVNTMRPHASLPAASASPQASEQASAVSSAALVKLRDQTLGSFFESFKAGIDRPVLVHWGRMQDLGIAADTPLELEIDAVSADVAFDLVAEGTADFGDQIAILERPGLIEIGLRSQFDRRTMERRTYDVAPLVGYRSANPDSGETSRRPPFGNTATVSEGARGIAMLLENHASPNDWVTRGGDLARYSIMGTTIIVTAPERIHQEIASMIEELVRKQWEVERAGLEAAQHRAREIADTVRELEAHYQSLFEEWSSLLRSRGEAFLDTGEVDTDRLEIIEFQRRDLADRMQSIRLRQSVLRSTHDNLVREWGFAAALEATRSRPTQEVPAAEVFYFTEEVSNARAAVIIPQGGTVRISQVLADHGYSPGPDETVFVYHRKAGEPREKFYRTTVKAIFSSPDADRNIGPGDSISVSGVFRRAPERR
ncbi:MAG: permease prefix domain 1-containing protein [Phycisphaerales bacterium]|nr:hypothetical protein [Planctomycetota bacterium]MCH8507439.1 permease prefix domain 1-containing protein [Phycisphaerales bacterium]